MTPRPPRLSSAMLARVSPADWREHIAGDLEEEFIRLAEASPRRARWWYRWQVLRVALSHTVRRHPQTGEPSRGGGIVRRIHTDIVSAWRAIRRQPRFALLLVGVLAASLGTSGLVFGIIDAYLWRPLPYPAAERLVRFTRTPGPRDVQQPKNLSALERERLLAEVADLALVSDADGFTIIDGTTPKTVLGAWTTADIFPAFGIRPTLGRVFTPEEVANASPVALISDVLWKERYGADPSIVGRTLTLRGVERPDDTTVFTVIGVLPPRFWHFNDRTAVVTPLRGSGDVWVFRLREGLTIEQAERRLTELVASANPSMDPRWRVTLSRLQEEHVAPVRDVLNAVGLAVGLLLLIACANLAMLQAVRAMGRQHEMAIRTALGAGRVRLLSQLLAENLLLATAAFGLACIVSQLLIHSAVPAVESYVGRLVPGGGASVGLTPRVLGLMAGASLLCTVVLGLLPNLRFTSRTASLRSHGAGNETRQRARARHVLVVLQVAATLALLVGASLMMRTAWHLSRTDLGFDPTNVLTGSIVIGAPAYPDAERQREGARRVLAALDALPEVDAAGLITGPPLGFRYPRAVYTGPSPEPDAPQAVVIGATPSYFRAVRLPIVAGRHLSSSDIAGEDHVAVISTSLAKLLWPSDDAVGRTLTTTALRPMRDGVEVGNAADALTPYRVVGVVADVRRSLRREAVPEIYVPLVQAPVRDLTIQVRGRDGVPQRDVLAAVARALGTVHSQLPLNGAEPLDTLIARQSARPRFLASVLGASAALAAAGALIGLYAATSWIARQRRREAAIRLALGAEPRQIIRTLTTSGALAVLAGLAVGWWASLGLERLLSSELTGVTGGDPATRAVLVVVLCLCCVMAIYRPARAVTQQSPAATLRE